MQHESGDARARHVLRPTAGVQDFLRAPIDRYCVGRNWLAFYRRHLSGVVFWGNLTVADILELARILPVRYLPPARPHPSFVDVRLVESVDPAVFDARAQLLDATREMSDLVTRCAIVHPPGLVGAVTVGLNAVAPPPFEEEFFVHPEDALRWLGHGDETSLLAELELLRTKRPGMTPLLARLRETLDGHGRMTLGQAARALAVSRRSLQRQLARAGTSYQSELTLATVRAAQALLMRTGASVTRVARDVGCASPQHLTTLFRKVVGESPAAWRQRRLASQASISARGG